MSRNTAPDWQTSITSALQQDPKKTGVLGFLVLILLVVSARMIFGGSHPSLASASRFAPGAVGGTPILIPSPVIKPDDTAASLRGWLSTPIPSVSRNDFLVKSEYFTSDATKKPPAAPVAGFWTALEKSLSVQADQKEKREAAIADLKVQAAALRPTSTMMGPTPRAMVNGILVGAGDTVQSFEVVTIEPRGIVVERDGVRLAIPMK